jgi:hypothetical protein
MNDFVDKIKNYQINITEDMMLERLADRTRWPIWYQWNQPTLQIIENGEIKTPDYYKTDSYIDSKKVIDYYNQGYTLVLAHVNYLFKDINSISDILSEYFKKEININAYFGKGTKTVSFLKHKHNYPVLVKSVFGSSEWIIDKKNVNLNNQDVIYFNTGIDHEVTKIHSTKLSLTCNLEKNYVF